MVLLTLGGAALVLDRADAGSSQVIGLIVVMVATAAWGVDNTVSRRLAVRDPGQVVMIKGALGATATAVLAAAFGEPVPRLWPALGLLAVGASGYGLSLRFYLLAQRAFGAPEPGRSCVRPLRRSSGGLHAGRARRQPVDAARR